MRRLFLMFCGVCAYCSTLSAAEITVKNDNNVDLALSIYNNTALIRDVRTVKLDAGRSSILFAGVSGQIKPETVIINADGVSVREQNYNFAMLSPENVAKANIGKVVKTVMWDDEKARNVYDKARILDVYAGRPVLQFGYGIEFDFPGRIIWENLPENLQTEPSLALGVSAQESGEKKLDLMYLTGGLRWSTNYVAEFINDTELNLKAWVSINNTSGIDYNNARVQLVAGDANIVREAIMARPMMMKAARGVDNAMLATAAVMPEEETVGDYHVYSLPEKISVADNQTKQVSLLSKDKIKYYKEYRLLSPLYLNINGNSSDFKKMNADVYVKLVNNTESNLGEPLPRGVMRFYDHDSKGNMLLIGESSFKELAVGNDVELRIGRSFDITASGKIINFSKIAENTVEAEVSVSFVNAKKTKAAIAFEQYFHNDWTILSANIEGSKQNTNTMRWLVDVPASGSAMLNFKVRIVKVDA